VRLLVHDFAGHPFQAQLSRALAVRGMSVVHAYSAQLDAGRGRLERTADDPAGLAFLPLSVPAAFSKYGARRRVRYELQYRRLLVKTIHDTSPDIVMLSNTPLLIARRAVEASGHFGCNVVLWHQDILSIAMAEEMHRRLPQAVAWLAEKAIVRTERRMCKDCDKIVAIGPAFLSKYREWGIDRSAITVIPNWAPLDEIFPVPRNNQWSAAWGLPNDTLRLVYAGNLGRKHNPGLLVDLVNELRSRGLNVHLTIVAQTDFQDEAYAYSFPPDCLILPFQSIDDLKYVLGSADVLIGLLEPSASAFSIPSKILSYLAAGRPVLGFMPASNYASSEVLMGAGRTFSPDWPGVKSAASWIMELVSGGPATIDHLGRLARQYAERRLALEPIVDQFVSALSEASQRGESGR
jgi:colanic acid biosynthesis glycosyl transferase WcaI